MKKYFIVCVIAILCTVAAWYFLIYTESQKGGIVTKQADTIYVGSTEAAEEGEAVENTSQNAVPEEMEGEADPAEQSAINDKLQKADGHYLRNDTGYIFVGDSRFVNMNTVCKISEQDNLFVVAKVGEGYSWFNNTALSQIKRIISTGLYSKWKVLICLGINDLGSIKKYTEKYTEIKDDFDISLISVNPVGNYGTLTNDKVSAFNSELKKLPFPYIDSYGVLISTGYETTDGLHYNNATSRKIFNAILLGIQDEDPEALTGSGWNYLDSASLATKKSIQSDISSQNKYVKKAAEPGTDIDPKLLEQFMESPEESDSQEENKKTAGGEGGLETETQESTEIPEELLEEEGMSEEEKLKEEERIRQEEARREEEKAHEKEAFEEQEKREEEERLKQEEKEREEEEKRKEEEKRREEEEEKRKEEERRKEEEERRKQEEENND